MKRKQILAAFLGAAVLLSLSGCGTSDKLASITLSTTNKAGFNLQGIGGTLQLTVTANYTSGKQVDETNFSTYTITAEGVDINLAPLPTPPLSIQGSPTGMLTAVDPGICTWTATGSSTKVSYFLSGDYKIVATYKGNVSQPVFVGVASASDPANPLGTGQCGP